jgi:hypothetical protein
MRFDRGLQPRQNAGNVIDIPFGRDYAALVDQPQLKVSIAEPGDRNTDLRIVDLLEFLFQRAHSSPSKHKLPPRI